MDHILAPATDIPTAGRTTGHGGSQPAEFAGRPNPDRLQGLLAKAAWDAKELRDRIRGIAVAALAADDAVLIADETGDIKKGAKTAGVQRMVEGSFQVAKGQVGLNEHVRKWCSWYRHTMVSMLAMVILVTIRSRLISRQPLTPGRRP
ncbi:transposase [Streptomyces sp. NPDC001793]|uniref:transposase n=1 Tax=Streptomyces sp. NPDC001793 TaxID=3154657 RepID=UPI00331BBFB5